MSDDEIEFVYSYEHCQQLQQQLQDEKKDTLTKSQQLKDVQNQYSLLQSENRELLSQIGRIKEMLETKTNQAEQNQREVESIKKTLDARDLSLVKLMNEKSELFQQLMNLNETLSKEKIDERERFIVQINLLEQTNQRLTKEKDIAIKDSKLMKDQISQKDSLISNLKKNLDDLQKEFTQEKQKQVKHKKKVDDLTKELQELKNNKQIQPSNEVKALNSQISQLKLDNKSLLEEIKILQQQKQIDTIKRVELEKQVIDNQNDIRMLEIQVQEQNKKLNINSSFIALPQNDQKDLLNKCALLEKQVQELKIGLKEANEVVIKLIAENDAINSKQENNTELQQLRKEVKNLQETLHQSPLSMIFVLLEYRLTQQVNGDNKQDAKNKQLYWKKCIDEWRKGFKDLQDQFKACNIVFNFMIQRQVEAQQNSQNLKLVQEKEK